MAAIPYPSPFPAGLVPLPPQPDGVPFPTAGSAGWPEGAPTGADVDRLEAEIERAFAHPNEVESPGLGQSLALLVVQGGRIVAERYHPEVGPDTALISWSMAKSVTHTLVGLLVRDGRFELGPVAAAHPSVVGAWVDDDRVDITAVQLLQMRSGLRWTEEYEHGAGDGTSLSEVLEMLFGRGAADMAAFAAAQPLDHRPGDHYYYSSGTSNILSALVHSTLTTSGPFSDPSGRAGGHGVIPAGEREQAMRRFMASELFEPLGMTSADPRFDPAGTFVGSSFFHATARDFARLGLLYLRDGVWDRRRLLPPGWVDAARTAQAVEPDSL
ncbi:MAG: beta-lactamase family protein, partial [Acidimicrobiia bacterium]|nr:beta-lactamase family protein [Acidimicrobiia bacterium]